MGPPRVRSLRVCCVRASRWAHSAASSQHLLQALLRPPLFACRPGPSFGCVELSTRRRRPAPPPGAPIPPISRLVRPRPSPPSSSAAALYRSLSLHRPSPLRVVHTRRFFVASPARRPPPPVLLRAPPRRRSSRRASAGLGLAVHPLLARSPSCGSSPPLLCRRLDSSGLDSRARPPFYRRGMGGSGRHRFLPNRNLCHTTPSSRPRAFLLSSLRRRAGTSPVPPRVLRARPSPPDARHRWPSPPGRAGARRRHDAFTTPFPDRGRLYQLLRVQDYLLR